MQGWPGRSTSSGSGGPNVPSDGNALPSPWCPRCCQMLLENSIITSVYLLSELHSPCPRQACSMTPPTFNLYINASLKQGHLVWKPASISRLPPENMLASHPLPVPPPHCRWGGQRVPEEDHTTSREPSACALPNNTTALMISKNLKGFMERLK